MTPLSDPAWQQQEPPDNDYQTCTEEEQAAMEAEARAAVDAEFDAAYRDAYPQGAEGTVNPWVFVSVDKDDVPW